MAAWSDAVSVGYPPKNDPSSETIMPTLPSIRSTRIIQAASLLLAVNLAFTACSGGSDTSSTEAVGPDVTVAGEETPDESTMEPEVAAEPTDEAEPVDEPEDDEPEQDGEPEQAEPVVPGEPLDFGPRAGTELTVVGVDFDDVLNFRAEPDPSSEILAIAVPTADVEILALGEAWAAPTGVWWKVSIDGQEAWANQRFLGGSGAPADIFAVVAAELVTLEYESLEDASRAVAATRASTDPASRIVFATEPLAFDAIGGFVTIDVLDIGDDSVKGERLRIEVEFVFDEDGDEGAQDLLGVIVTAVEATPICGRGVSAGLCV